MPEYGNSEIRHNVEFSLHPVLRISSHRHDGAAKSVTNAKLVRLLKSQLEGFNLDKSKAHILLDGRGILRNACMVARTETEWALASLTSMQGTELEIELLVQHSKPYAMFE